VSNRAEGRYDRFPELAAELVGLQVAVIAAFSPAAALAAISATKTIPIIFISSADPVKLGMVASLSRPGGNATGVSFFDSELVGKQFELLHELMPKVLLWAARATCRSGGPSRAAGDLS